MDLNKSNSFLNRILKETPQMSIQKLRELLLQNFEDDLRKTSPTDTFKIFQLKLRILCVDYMLTNSNLPDHIAMLDALYREFSANKLVIECAIKETILPEACNDIINQINELLSNSAMEINSNDFKIN